MTDQVSRLEEHGRPRALLGVLVAVAGVALTTLLIVPLDRNAPVEALGVAYVPSVLLVASVWGGALGYGTALLSAAAFNWFHLPPTGRFHLNESENWVSLGVLLVVALVAGTLAERARARAEEAEQRQLEAELATEMARLLLGGPGRLADALPMVSQNLARALDLPGAAIELGSSGVDLKIPAIPLHEDRRRIGALILPADVSPVRRARIQRHVVPSLEALLSAALERDALLGETVETAALRRSDVLKTALLRSVSHDLRTPLTAILAAEEALRSPQLSEGEHDALVDDVGHAARRLSRLVEKLLDLSRLEADGPAGRREACSVAEVLEASIDHLALPEGTFSVSVEREIPDILADAGQVERAFANLLENAARYSGGHPVSVRARRVADRVVVRIVDRGPGLPNASLERVFEPFYRGDPAPSGSTGSGLGLAIVRGFIDANGGRVWAESAPGQGTAFVVEFPLAMEDVEPVVLAAPADSA